jgi:hypothetical protein
LQVGDVSHLDSPERPLALDQRRQDLGELRPRDGGESRGLLRYCTRGELRADDFCMRWWGVGVGGGHTSTVACTRATESSFKHALPTLTAP